MQGIIERFIGASPTQPTVTANYQRVNFPAPVGSRSGVLVRVSGSAPLDVHDSASVAELPWYTISPGSTFLVPWASGIDVFVKGAGAVCQLQEVSLV